MTESASTDVDGMSPEAHKYLTEALALIREHSMYRDRVDWEAVEAHAYRRAWGARVPADTYGAIRLALNELGDRHSFIMTPEQVSELEDGTLAASAPEPRGELLEERVGYLSLPGWAGSREAAGAYATRIQAIIRELDAAGPCGWIVDLRENMGGSMWPMLAGVGPILGEGRVGAFVYPEATSVDWLYTDGQARMGDVVETEIEGPAYTLADPGAPVVVLIGRHTVSSGEAMAVAFRGRPESRSFGELTAGLSTSNREFVLGDGAWLLLTVAAFADRTGQVYGSGIIPDEVVTWRGDKSEAVPQAAIAWLLEQPACRTD
jgi:hypothetical protein